MDFHDEALQQFLLNGSHLYAGSSLQVKELLVFFAPALDYERE